MTTLTRRLAAVAVLVSAVSVSAQPPAPLPPATSPPATVLPGTAPGATERDYAPTPYRAKEVLGSKVLLGATQTVGVIDDIVFSEVGQIEYLIVADAGKLVTVPWDAAKFDMKARTATLTITPQVYQTIPTYTVTTYPAFYTPAYRTATYRYYGIAPGEYRRAMRQGARDVVPILPRR